MAAMPPIVRMFVMLLLGAWAALTAWSALSEGQPTRWLLALFLVACVSYLRKNHDPGVATLLPPAGLALSFGLEALQDAELGIALACLIGFCGLLAIVVHRASRPLE